MERPKVIYNKRTKKFVMWFHLELKSKGYEAARAGVAVSDFSEGTLSFCFFRSCLPWNISPEYDGGRTGHAVEYGTV